MARIIAGWPSRLVTPNRRKSRSKLPLQKVRLRAFGGSGVTAFALALLRAKAGGEGSRTPVSPIEVLHCPLKSIQQSKFQRRILTDCGGNSNLYSNHFKLCPVYGNRRKAAIGSRSLMITRGRGGIGAHVVLTVARRNALRSNMRRPTRASKPLGRSDRSWQRPMRKSQERY